jgi:hypothetical protein
MNARAKRVLTILAFLKDQLEAARLLDELRVANGKAPEFAYLKVLSSINAVWQEALDSGDRFVEEVG